MPRCVSVHRYSVNELGKRLSGQSYARLHSVGSTAAESIIDQFSSGSTTHELHLGPKGPPFESATATGTAL